MKKLLPLIVLVGSPLFAQTSPPPLALGSAPTDTDMVVLVQGPAGYRQQVQVPLLQLKTYSSNGVMASPNTANGFVQLNGSAQLPAVNGSQLTNLPTIVVGGTGTGYLTITSGSLTLTHTVDTANGFVTLNGSSKLPAVDGSLLTNLPGGPASTVLVDTNLNEAVKINSTTLSGAVSLNASLLTSRNWSTVDTSMLTTVQGSIETDATTSFNLSNVTTIRGTDGNAANSADITLTDSSNYVSPQFPPIASIIGGNANPGVAGGQAADFGNGESNPMPASVTFVISLIQGGTGDGSGNSGGAGFFTFGDNSSTLATVIFSNNLVMQSGANNGGVAEFYIVNSGALTTVTFDGSVTLGYAASYVGSNPIIFQVASNSSLATITIPSLVFSDAINPYSISFSGNALPQAQVDALILLVYNAALAQGSAVGVLDVSGGTNATPSTTGLANAALLVGLGWTVNTN